MYCRNFWALDVTLVYIRVSGTTSFILARLFFIWHNFFLFGRDFFTMAQLYYDGATLCCCSFSYCRLEQLFGAVSQQHDRDCSGTILRRQVFDIIRNKMNNLLPAWHLHVIRTCFVLQMPFVAEGRSCKLIVICCCMIKRL